MFWRFFLVCGIFISSIFASQNINIGVLANRSSETTLQNWSATAEYLTNKIPQYNFTIIPLDFEELKHAVKEEKISFVLTNTFYYVELEYLYGVSRIATLKNRSFLGTALTNFGAVIITAKNSPITSIEELENKKFGAVDKTSFGGWVMAQKELLNHDITTDDFQSFQFLGSHDKVVMAVKNGEIDAGTLRTDILEKMESEKQINLDDFRILAPKQYPNFPYLVSTELYPEWPFAKLSSTSSSLANLVVIALLQMPSFSNAATNANIEGWTIPLDYSKVHTLLQELHLGPYVHLGEITIRQVYEKYALWIYCGILIFLIILGVLIYIKNLNNSLHVKQKEVKELNQNLEKRVEQRTLELHKAYSHEKYLKDVLKTVANVNELLISSFSTQSVLQNCIETLSQHEQYPFVWMGLVEEDSLKVITQSSYNKKLTYEQNFILDSKDDNHIISYAKEAIKQNATSTNPLKHVQHCPSCWLISIPLHAQDHNKAIGVLCVFSNKQDGFETEEIHMLENLANDVGMVLHSISQRSMLQLMEEQKLSNYEETILAFVSIIEQRDSYTAGHTLRVAEYCRLIAQEMDIEKSLITKLEKAAVLHDIGKVVTPDAILLKPGKLTLQEYELIKQHVFAGYKMLCQIEMYKDLADIILYHHARYDGKGYPSRSLEEPDPVPLLSYIMAVADAFDAMTTNRIYKGRKGIKEALEEVKELAGTQFHPDVAKYALKALAHIKLNETNQLPTTELEQRRFAYFFMDSLTEVYNENYLKTFLAKQEDQKRCLYIIEIKHFSTFNTTHGWENGNEFLKNFSIQLQSLYPEAMTFRYHGDDFVLLFEKHHEITKEAIKTCPIFENTNLDIEIVHHDFKDEIPNL